MKAPSISFDHLLLFQALSNLTKMVFNGSNVLGDQNGFYHSVFCFKTGMIKLDAQTIIEHPIYSVHGIPKRVKLNGPIKRKSYTAKNDLNESIQNPGLIPKYPKIILPNRTQFVLIICDQFQISNMELTRIQSAKSGNIPYLEPVN